MYDVMYVHCLGGVGRVEAWEVLITAQVKAVSNAASTTPAQLDCVYTYVNLCLALNFHLWELQPHMQLLMASRMCVVC